MSAVSGRERKRNPLINSASGGRALSAAQLPLFMLHPPRGFGVLTTTGRKSGKSRRRCIRAARVGERVYIVAIKGARTAWVKNVEATPQVRLRLPGGSFDGVGRRLLDEDERREAVVAYCGRVNPFDYLECMLWRSGRPTRAKIEDLHRGWFERGTPLVIRLRPG